MTTRLAEHYHKQGHETKAIILTVLACFFFAAMASLVRHLSVDFSTSEILLFRNTMSLLLIIPCIVMVDPKLFKTSKWKLYSYRGMNGFVSMLFWFSALSMVPLGDAVASSFLTPIFTTIIAMIFLKEKIGYHRILAILIGIGGMMLILKPTVQGIPLGYIYAVIAAGLWAISNILVKTMTKTEHPLTIVFYMVLFMTPLSFIGGFSDFKMPTSEQWMWFLLLGFVANGAQLTISYAYRLAEVTLLMPFDFTRLIFTALISYFAFGEILDPYTFIGAIIIMVSSVYITYREARVRRGMIN